MSEPKHTPGPWTWRETMTPGSVMGSAYFTNVRLGGDPVASARVLGADSLKSADAALIAAAPDLLDACAKASAFVAYALEFWDWSRFPHSHEPVEALLAEMGAALAKAKGGAA